MFHFLMQHGTILPIYSPQKDLPMNTLTDMLQNPIVIETKAQALSFLRVTLLALSDELKPEASGYKTNRQTFFRANKLLVDWEACSAFGKPILFQTEFPSDFLKD